VAGNLIYWSQTEASIDEQAVVGGEVTKHLVQRSEFPKKDFVKFFVGLKIFFKLVGFISALVLGLILISFYPNYSRRTAETIQAKPWAALGIGLLALIVTPVVIAVLLASVIGLPLAFILMASYFIYLSLAKVFVMLLIGYGILRSFKKDVALGWSLIVGVIAFYLITMIPVLGGLLAGVALLLGLGAMLIAGKQAYIEAKDKKII